MSTATIGDGLQQEFGRTDLGDPPGSTYQGDRAGDIPHGYSEQLPSDSRLAVRGDSVLRDIVDAQQRLIMAHHQFLHDNDLAALARAQLDVLSVHNSILDRLGVFGRNG